MLRNVTLTSERDDEPTYFKTAKPLLILTVFAIAVCCYNYGESSSSSRDVADVARLALHSRH